MNITATEILATMKTAEMQLADMQNRVLKPYIARALLKLWEHQHIPARTFESGITRIILGYPQRMRWWEKVLTWNPCNDFVPKVLRIEPIQMEEFYDA